MACVYASINKLFSRSWKTVYFIPKAEYYSEFKVTRSVMALMATAANC